MSNVANTADFYDITAQRLDWFRKFNWYYHQDLVSYYKFLIPPNSKVLEVGCGTGSLLNAVNPSIGVGIDISSQMIKMAKAKYPRLTFLIMDAQKINLREKFDYIIISGTIGDLYDIHKFLTNLRSVADKNTRIVIDYYNHLWQPILRLSELISAKTPQIYRNFLPTREIENLLHLSDFEVIRKHNRLLLPVYLPFISKFVNGFISKLPYIRSLCLNRFIVARPHSYTAKSKRSYSVSVIVPARNEQGTIEKIIKTIPKLGKLTEIIFIEGHSTDNTRWEIQRMIKKYPRKFIRLIIQKKGWGKADAVHLGFDKAKGDILMILDADLSVEAGELEKFYEVLVMGKAEFISGSRLIYPRQHQAMKFLNLIGNHLFGIIFTWLLEHPVTDTLCGTKVLWKSDYRKFKEFKNNYFGNFDPFGDFELLFSASKMNLKCLEIPVSYKARVYGSTNINRSTDFWLLLRMCWIAFWKLKYV